MRSINVTIFILFFCGTAFAQFSDSIHYYGKFASTGSINQTNEGNSYLLSNMFKVGVSKKKIVLNGSGSWVYGQSNGELTNNDFSSSLDFSLFRAVRQIYYWGLANYDKSFSLKINDRFQAGAGIAYNFLDRKTTYLSVSDGFIWEKGDLFIEDTIHDVYDAVRNSFRVSYKFVFKELITIDGTHFFQPNITDISDYNLKSVNSIAFNLRKWLAITASMTYNKVTRTGRENLLFTYGLTLEKYF
ncbi:DUF481 domain-containing protein [Chitinophaga silvisoli]|uniref:DUF481 domain-containing protein n=1 Tax=Chitinophaga silvisoli TaxID=2291814 RepID=A0A3E1NSH9_9BACT|nr:DUF481 domain-containing protein [Chitinophaga silvisoli]RFM30718.1 DUF481 domain-containing protein [Chitinophaga silvisoli]